MSRDPVPSPLSLPSLSLLIHLPASPHQTHWSREFGVAIPPTDFRFSLEQKETQMPLLQRPWGRQVTQAAVHKPLLARSPWDARPPAPTGTRNQQQTQLAGSAPSLTSSLSWLIRSAGSLSFLPSPVLSRSRLGGGVLQHE